MGFFLDNGVCRCIYPKKDKEGDFFLGWNSLSQRHRIQSTECRVQSTEYRHTEMAWHAVLGNGDDEEEMLLVCVVYCDMVIGSLLRAH